MPSIVIDTTSEAQTAELGRALAGCLPENLTVALDGTLGAGKTRLVQAIAAAWGVPPGVVLSPTFVLMQEYQAAKRLVHLDAYRLRDDDEFLALGADEFMNSSAIVFIEWAERVVDCLPADRLRIEIEEIAEQGRRFTITAFGPHSAPVISALEHWTIAART